MTMERFLNEVLPGSTPGMVANPAQVAYAKDVAKALGQKTGSLHCIQGGTGIGKTLAYLLAATDWLNEGTQQRPRRVVIATYSRSLQRQVIDEGHQKAVAEYARFQGIREPRVALRMGRQNYVSPNRLAHVLGATHLESVIEDPKRTADERRLAEWAHTTEGCLLDLDPDILPPHIQLRDIQVSRHDPLPQALAQQQADAEAADIMVINHALLVSNLARDASVFGQSRPDDVALILDEAEHFPDVAEQILSDGVSYRQVANLARTLGYRKIADDWSSLLDQYTDPTRGEQTEHLSDEHANAVGQALKRIQRTRKVDIEKSADHAEWADLRELSRHLAKRIDQGDQHIGVNRSPIRGLPSLVAARPTAAGILNKGLDSRRTILTSATLGDINSTPREPHFVYILTRLMRSTSDPDLGVMAQHEPTDFGRLSFQLPEAPCYPLVAGQDQRRLADAYAAHAIPWATGCRNGRTLVLCNSYNDVDILIHHWPDRERARLVTHPVGANLNSIAESMGANDVLLTPAGWEGLSPQRDGAPFWSRVVLLRNPTPPINATQAWMIAASLQRREKLHPIMARHRAQQILHSRNRTQAAHRLRQGIGRAIRHRNDRCEIVILDPRFHKSSRRQGSGLAGLAAAIPTRFHQKFLADVEHSREAQEAESSEAPIIL